MTKLHGRATAGARIGAARARKRDPAPALTILDAVADQQLFKAHFKDPNSWQAWFAYLSALFALGMTPEQLAIYQQCTGRTAPPTSPARESWLICGRRSGKSFMLALLAVYAATFRDWRPFLQVGERATVQIIAADRKQAAIIVRYIKSLLQGSPLLSSMITAERSESIDLDNRVSFEIITSSSKLSRGRAVCVCLLDELAFWSVDEYSSEPDTEVIRAIRPSMAQFGEHALMLCASSPYARLGELWNAFRRHYGREADPILVWRAATRVMNPSIGQSIINEAMLADPASARAEFMAEFRSDIESFITLESVMACVEPGVLERAPLPNTRYFGFCDPSGGSVDSAVGAVAHLEDGIAVLDCLREIGAPHSPEAAVAELASMFKSYGVMRITGDKYAGQFPADAYRKFGIAYEASAQPKSNLYRDCLPLINSRKVDLLDHQRLIAQFCALERRTSRAGKDSIDHAPGGHDDVCNAVAGAVVAAHLGKRQQLRVGCFGYGGPVTELDPRTLEPFGPHPRLHIRIKKMTEQAAPAVRGP